MNAVTTQEALPIETLEQVLATGDISKLTSKQKVAYYVRTCESLGLNPLTRPFRFLRLNNQEQLYATRDCTDQLRKVHGINLQIVEKKVESGVLIVTARAQTKDGRHDEDIGAVTLPPGGESRANAVMKAITKAKRRVTLSICGLGMSDESELDTMPGAYTYDPNDPTPTIGGDAPQDAREAINDAVPMPAAAAATPRPPRRTEAATASYTDAQWKAWLAKTSAAMDVLRSRQEVVEVGERESVKNAIEKGPDWLKRDLDELLHHHYTRFPDDETPVDDDPFAPGLEIVGEDKLAAG